MLGILASTRDIESGTEPRDSGRLEKQTTLEDQVDEDTAAEGVDNGRTEDHSVSIERAQVERKGTSEMVDVSRHRAGTIFGLLSACETELLRAERDGSVHVPTSTPIEPPLIRVADTFREIHPTIYEPLLPPSVTDRFHEAMHEALMNVMAERDEAHAQFIAANVLQTHQLEQEKRKNERLQIKLHVAQEMARIQQPSVAQFFGKFDDKPRKALEAKLESFERILGKNGEDEMVSLCHQLAGEISAKTSHALEISRLKETRESQRQSEAAEKQALKEELKRVKALLAEEQRQRKESEQEG